MSGVIDDQSEPGSWAQHLRDTEAMRAQHNPFTDKDDSRGMRRVGEGGSGERSQSTGKLPCEDSGQGSAHGADSACLVSGAPIFAFGNPHWPGLAKLNQECGAVIQEIGKLMMTGGDPVHWSGDLRERLLAEIADMLAAGEFVLTECFSAEERLRARNRMADKTSKFQHWDRNPHDEPRRPSAPVMEAYGAR